MAYTTINKSSEHFNTKLYTGTGSSNAVTGVGFQPDWIWIKNRGRAEDHAIFDAVRGASGGYYGKIRSNDTAAQEYDGNGMSAIGSDGFTVLDQDQVNKSSDNYASWNWKANGAGSANTDGSQNTTVSVNTTAGFSIVKWTGADGTASLGHGLGAVPKMIIAKRLASRAWTVYHASVGANKKLVLNTTAAEASSADFDAVPTSSVINVGYTDDVNGSGADYIAYCFAEKTGYSKFGKFTGNGSTDNAFIYTGFKPAFVMMKCNSVTEGWSNWYMFDTARNPTNMNTKELMANKNNVESDNGADYAQIDMLSNGFKIRNGSAWGPMVSGRTSIYMCFAEAPLVGSNNVPCTAR